jgi:hypothetical protein
MLLNYPHNGGQYFAEKRSIKTNIAGAQSTAVSEMSRGRVPDRLRIFIRTFGSYVQWSSLGEGEKPNHKMDEKTHDGCFISIEWP